MKVFVNSRNEIVDIGATMNKDLKEYELPDDTFNEWSVARICCHKLIIKNGAYCGYTPFMDSRQIERLEAQEIINTNLQLAIAELGVLISTREV